MGDKTPESVEIKCPGCGTRFRMTPKKGRLPSGDIPCPKCYEEIPVRDGEVVSAGENSSDGDGESNSSAPKFGVMSPARRGETKTTSEKRTSTEAEDAIARLEQMAKDLPKDSSSTMAGLPGVGANPFKASRQMDKTAAVDRSILEKVAIAQPADDLDEDDDAGRGASFAPANQPDTSPRLVSAETIDRLAQENSEAAVAPDDMPDDEETRPPGLRQQATTARRKAENKALRETAENKSISADMVRETAENKSITPEMVKKSRRGDDEEEKKSPPKSNVLARIKKHQVLKKVGTSRPNAQGSDSKTIGDKTSPSINLDKLRKKSAGDGAADGDSEAKSLSDLFDKVKKKRGTDAGRLRKKLLKGAKKTSASAAKKKKAVPSVDLGDELSDSELADIVDQSTDKTEKEEAPLPGLPTSKTAPPTREDKAGEKSEKATDHSGLFDSVAASPTPEVESPEIGGVSRSKGTTSTSMLARLQRRRDRGDNVDPIKIGAAGERRGSGYIRLPTAEIQDVLGHGDFRLKIEGVVYEPVDKEGLIQLIKGGVLLGAEEIAEADGDWMPASEHPVFGELRRKMAAEAHEVLSRIGSTARKETAEEASDGDDLPAPKAATLAGPPVPASVKKEDSAPAPESVDQPEESPAQAEEIPPEPATMELSQTETAALVSGMTDKFAAIDGDKPPEDDEYDQEFKTRESFEAIPIEPVDSVEPVDQSGDETIEDTDESNDGLDDLADDEFDADEFDADEFDQGDDDGFAGEFDETEPVAPPPEAAVAASAESEAVDEFPADPEQPSKKSPLLLVVGLLGVLIAAAAAMAITEPGQDIVEDLTGWNPAVLFDEAGPTEEKVAEAVDEVDPALVEAVAKAREVVVEAVPMRQFSDQARVDAWVDERIAEDAFNEAAEVLLVQWDEGRRDAEFLELFAGVLIETEDYLLARRAAMAGIVEFPEHQGFAELHQQAVQEDGRLRSYEPVQLLTADDFQATGIYDTSGHRGFLLESPEHPQERLLFKPERSQWAGDWRVEVAAWRFCELVVCHFEIFRVEPAIMTREFLDELVGDTDQFAQLAAQADWQILEVDGQDVEAVRGSLEYIPNDDLAPFPIEFRPLWRNWVTAGTSPQSLEGPVTDHLQRIEDLADGAFYDGLVASLADVPTTSVAREVSSLLLFDFLTNNWERFFTRSENYGLNNPVYAGQLVSRHNGDAFQPRTSRRVQGRFEWTTRFSRSTVASIRALERDLTFEVLFPEARATDRRLQIMWSQREAMLERVDQLSARHGEEDVLRFP